MNKLVFACFIGLASVAVAAPKEDAASLAQRKAEFYQKTGGLIRKPNSEKGKIVFVNAQNRVSDGELRKVAQELTDAYHLVFEVVHTDPVTPQTAAKAIKLAGGNAGVVVTALSAEDPALMVFPDLNCSLVNVAAFPEKDAAVLVRKEAARGFAAACGAMSSQVEMTLMNSFDNLKQLAAFPGETIPADIGVRVKNHLRAQGVTPFSITTYKHACREGWAHQPTNEVERVIFEQMKAELNEQPSNPIKIKPGQKPLGK